MNKNFALFFSRISDFFRTWSARGKPALLGNQNGATAIEYVLLLATITLVGIAAADHIADAYKDQASDLQTTLSDAENKATQP